MLHKTRESIDLLLCVQNTEGRSLELIVGRENVTVSVLHAVGIQISKEEGRRKEQPGSVCLTLEDGKLEAGAFSPG